MEIGEAIGNKREDSLRTERIGRFDGIQRVSQRTGIVLRWRALQLGREEQAVNRPETEGDAIDVVRRRQILFNVVLNIRQSGRSSMGCAFGHPAERLDGGEGSCA